MTQFTLHSLRMRLIISVVNYIIGFYFYTIEPSEL